MSQETNEANLSYNPNSEPERNPNRNSSLIYIGIIIALLAACIYLYVSRTNAVQRSDATADTLSAVITERDDIQAEFDAALTRLDLLTSRNAQMDSIISARNSDVQRLRSEIQGILNDKKATTADLTRARAMIALLNTQLRAYEERIAVLEKENEQLANLNKTVTEERDSTVTKNIALAQKVRLGAVLHASNIRLQPIDLRRGGRKERETSRARRVDVLRVSFDIDENRIAESGVKELYLRVIAPDGSLLSNAAYGSGVTETYDGQTLNYTMAKQIDLRGGEAVRNVVVDWHQDSDYGKGSYRIEIFHDGYKIGMGSITLR